MMNVVMKVILKFYQGIKTIWLRICIWKCKCVGYMYL